MKKRHVLVFLAALMLVGCFVLQGTNSAATVYAKDMSGEETSFYNAENFCVQMYKNAFKGNEDQKVLSMMIQSVYTGDKNGIEIAYDILTSETADEVIGNYDDYINASYQVLLNRMPSDEEMTEWKEKLRAGMSKEYLVCSLGQSDEFLNICNDYGIERGKMETEYYKDKDFAVTQFFNNMFVCFYDRTADPVSLEYYCKEYFENGMTFENACYEFMTSDEYLLRNFSNEDFITRTYDLICGKEIPEEEKNNYMSRLDNGELRETLTSELFQSKEYLSRMKIRYINVVSFGDSLASGSGIEEEMKYQNIIAGYLDADIETYGYAGYTYAQGQMTDSLTEMVKNITETDDYSLVLVEAGTNDFVIGAVPGELGTDDLTTVSGSLDAILQNIKQKLPNADVVVLSPVKDAYDGQINSIGLTLKTYCDIIKQTAEANGCTFLNLYDDTAMQFNEDITNYTIDGVHLKENAHEIMAEEIINMLQLPGAEIEEDEKE